MKLRLSTNLEEMLPFLKPIYDEGWDRYLKDILEYYNIAPKKHHITIYVVEIRDEVVGVLCFKNYQSTSWLMWWNLPDGITLINIINRLDYYCGTDGVYYAHIEKYDKEKIKAVEHNGFINISTVKDFRVKHNFAKNFFYSDKDYIFKLKLGE
jgi:hypothetical protein